MAESFLRAQGLCRGTPSPRLLLPQSSGPFLFLYFTISCQEFVVHKVPWKCLNGIQTGTIEVITNLTEPKFMYSFTYLWKSAVLGGKEKSLRNHCYLSRKSQGSPFSVWPHRRSVPPCYILLCPLGLFLASSPPDLSSRISKSFTCALSELYSNISYPITL